MVLLLRIILDNGTVNGAGTLSRVSLELCRRKSTRSISLKFCVPVCVCFIAILNFFRPKILDSNANIARFRTTTKMAQMALQCIVLNISVYLSYLRSLFKHLRTISISIL